MHDRALQPHCLRLHDCLVLITEDQAKPLARLLRRSGVAFEARSLSSSICQVIISGAPYSLLRALRALGLSPVALRRAHGTFANTEVTRRPVPLG